MTIMYRLKATSLLTLEANGKAVDLMLYYDYRGYMMKSRWERSYIMDSIIVSPTDL